MNKETPKLYLSMILGDFEPVEIVKRSIDSVKDQVDGMYITVTYTDHIPHQTSPVVKLLKRYGANISFFKWTSKFAEARQFALEQVPKGPHSYIYWQDADDVLQGAEYLHKIMEEMDQQVIAASYFVYWYQVILNDDGTVKDVLVKHTRERVIRNDDTFHWVGKLHETLIEQKQENLLRVPRNECTVIHLTNGKRLDDNIDRNIKILEASAIEEQHRDPRTLVYLAKAYFDKMKLSNDLAQRKIWSDLALNLFNEYLNGVGKPGEEGYQEPSGWKEERSTAWAYIGEIAFLSGSPLAAIGAFQNAIDEWPFFPDYYIDMAMMHVVLGDFDRAEHWLNVATSLPDPKTTIIQFPQQLRVRALETSLQINLHKQRLKFAREDLEQLVEIFSDNADYKQELEKVKELEQFNTVCQSAVSLGKYLEAKGETNKIPHLLQSFTKDMHMEKFAAEMRHRYLPLRVWAEDEITLLCGPGVGEWSPKSTKEGLGGSEEAVVHLADKLTKFGWKVTVYANPGKDAGNFNGVEYRPWYELNPLDSFNVLVMWRTIGFVDLNPKAKFIMVWMHDMPNNPDFTEERLKKIDKIAVLSEFHRDQLRMFKDGNPLPMPANKVFLTANGIPDDIFTNPVFDIEKKPVATKRLFYSSSPDRGLVYLLKNWNKVTKEVPDAELHVYYGFETYDVLHKGNPARMQWKDQVMKMMQQPGIVYHGRIGHDELHYEIWKSGIWAYPTDFTEISCITAMKAQALGALPVVTDFAALSETVKHGVRVDVDITSEEGQEEYIKALVDVMKDPSKFEDIRKPMMEWARKYFTWTNVASEWDKLFRIRLQNPEKKMEV